MPPGPQAKRPKCSNMVASLASKLQVPQAHVAEALRTEVVAADSQQRTKWSCAKQFRRSLNDSIADVSPYGALIQTTEIGVNGKFQWHYANPFALLYISCARSRMFGVFLRKCLEGQKGKIVIYHDECKPGNVLRPDEGKELLCLYWSLLHVPFFSDLGNAGSFI